MKLRKEKLHIYLIALIAFVLPNIVLLKKVPQPLDSLYYMAFPRGEYNYDFFSYYKMLFLIFSTALLSLLFFMNKIKKLKWHKSYTFLLIYAFFIVISTFTSPFMPVAIRGVGDRYEGITVLISYIILFYVTHSSIEDRDDIKIILGGIIGGSLVVGTIGIFQYFGIDFFRSDFGKKLILSSKDEYLKDSLEFQFGKYTIYSTLYNTNFVGSYMIMLFFLSITLFLENAKKQKYKYITYFYSIFIFANLIGCRSRAGFMGMEATSIFALIFFFRYFKIYFKQILLLLCSFVLVFVLMDRFSKDYSDLSAKLFKISTFKNTLRNVYTDKEYLVFEDINCALKMKIDDKNINFYDLENKNISYEIEKRTFKNGDSENEERNVIVLKDKKYKDFVFVPMSNYINFLYRNDFEFPIYFSEGKYRSSGIGKRLYDIVNIERIKFFDGKEKTGSNRIYIWSRTIPLLKYTLFAGYGPDTFSLIFPQNDNLGKRLAFGTSNIIVDKPHNLYLQIGVNTGLLSLINFVMAAGAFWIFGIFIYIKKSDLQKDILNFGLYLGTIGYLVTALFNDSLLSVAPIFWIFWALALYSSENYSNHLE